MVVEIVYWKLAVWISEDLPYTLSHKIPLYLISKHLANVWRESLANLANCL